MSRTPRKGETPTKLNRPISKSPNSSSKAGLSQSKDPLFQETYFCHYRNAMYMGSTKIFQRDGRGILLHDDGTSALTSYEKDMLHGYNLMVMPDNSLVSAKYNKNKLVEVAYKRQGLLFFGRFSHQMLDGTASLINYEQKEIVHVLAKKGVILEKKQEQNQAVLNKIFEIGNLEPILPEEHIKNLSFQLGKIKDLDVVRRGSKITVGFSKNGFLNGLAFVVGQQTINPSSTHDVGYHLIERGYYKNSQLNGLGERRFRNGNVYIGEFKNNQFEGTGILKNNLKKNWVSGQFERGSLTELGKYSNDGTEKTSLKILEGIHQRKTSWVSKDISLTNSLFLDNEIQKIQQFRNNEKMINLEARRQEMLRRIQDNFITDFQEEGHGQEAPVKTAVLMDSPLQRYLKSEVPQSHYRHQTESANQNSMRSDSGSKLQSSRKKIFGEQSLSFRQEIPKQDSYHIQVHPVLVEQSFHSRAGKEQEVYMRDSNRLKPEESSHRMEEPAAHNQSNSQAIRDSLTLVGPKVHTFATQRQPYARTATKSPQIGSFRNDSSQQRRKEDILESMYRRELKRSQF